MHNFKTIQADYFCRHRFCNEAVMKNKDIYNLLLGLLIMIFTYWFLFYQMAPANKGSEKVFVSLPQDNKVE